MNCKVQNWKRKAIERRIEVWAKSKRNSELQKSRDSWKSKYCKIKLENKKLLQQLKGQKKKESVKIKHHTYSADFISLCLNLRILGGCSLRGCLKVINVFIFMLDLELAEPSPSSIRNWEMKIGYYKVHTKCEEVDSDWVLIIDESVSVGSQKILLLLGINLSKYSFKSPLAMSDIEVLSIKIKKSWCAEEIDKVIEQLNQRHYSFKYCCSDNGNNLRKVLKMNNLIHIEDCGHCMGKILEKKYKKEDTYLSFCKEKAVFQKRNLLSKHAVFLPPKHRTKGRYMNLGSTIKWALKVLKVAKDYEQLTEKKEEFKQIKWLLNYEKFIINLHAEQVLIDQTNKILKSNGLSKQTIRDIEEQIEKSGVAEDFCDKIRDYLNRNIKKLPNITSLICSSDIIESIFGKFKNSISHNSMAGLTEGSLAIANYGKKHSPLSVIKAVEAVKIDDIKEWRKENLPLSIHQQRARLFKSTG